MSRQNKSSRNEPVDAEQQTRGILIAFQDLLIGVSAPELGYAVMTHNVRHFQMIPNLVVEPALRKQGAPRAPTRFDQTDSRSGTLGRRRLVRAAPRSRAVVFVLRARSRIE